MAQTVKHLPTVWETRVQSLGQEDLLEEEMTTHSSILAWKIAWTLTCVFSIHPEGFQGLQSGPGGATHSCPSHGSPDGTCHVLGP